MPRLPARGALVLALAALGCSSGSPELLSATPAGVTYSYRDSSLAAATEAARAYCRGFGRAVALHAADDGVAAFLCR